MFSSKIVNNHHEWVPSYALLQVDDRLVDV